MPERPDSNLVTLIAVEVADQRFVMAVVSCVVEDEIGLLGVADDRTEMLPTCPVFECHHPEVVPSVVRRHRDIVEPIAIEVAHYSVPRGRVPATVEIRAHGVSRDRAHWAPGPVLEFQDPEVISRRA